MVAEIFVMSQEQKFCLVIWRHTRSTRWKQQICRAHHQSSHYYTPKHEVWNGTGKQLHDTFPRSRNQQKWYWRKTRHLPHTNGNRRNHSQYIQNIRKVKNVKNLQIASTVTSKSATCNAWTGLRMTPLKEKGRWSGKSSFTLTDSWEQSAVCIKFI
jgi:hypothetical protein